MKKSLLALFMLMLTTFSVKAQWSLTGNSGTNPTTNFLGTTDNADLILKRNSVRAGLLGASNISFGVSALNTGTTGTDLIGIGVSALASNTSGSSNIGADAAPGWAFPQTYEAKEMAHEMGHNIGSPHTQACAWNDNCTPIDGCAAPEGDGSLGACANCSTVVDIPNQGGTIMSYCDTKAGIGVLLANGFGTQPGNKIRSKITNAGCLGSCNTDCLADVTISGAGYPGTYYNMPLTESSTWIKTNGTTKVLGGVVKLDANASSYVELNPGFEATYDYVSTNSVFIAEAHDGCTTGAPSFSSRRIEQEDERKKEISSLFSVYPNPAANQFVITGSMDIGKAKLELFDINGKPQMVQFNGKGNNRLLVNVANLTKGVYIIKLTTGTKIEFGKITVL